MRWPFTRTGEGDCAAAANDSSRMMKRQARLIAHQCTPGRPRAGKVSLLAITAQGFTGEMIERRRQQSKHDYSKNVGEVGMVCDEVKLRPPRDRVLRKPVLIFANFDEHTQQAHDAARGNQAAGIK